VGHKLMRAQGGRPLPKVIKMVKYAQEILDDAWNYINDELKNIQDKKRRIFVKELLYDYKEEFCTMPSAKKHHHNITGGLLMHTAQVLKWALKIYDENKVHLPGIKRENVYVAAVMHDFSKVILFEKDESGKHEYKYKDGTWNFEHDVWIIDKLVDYNVKPTYDEMMGILQAHGGWSKIKEPSNKLAAIIHCADMISSQLLKNSGEI